MIGFHLMIIPLTSNMVQSSSYFSFVFLEGSLSRTSSFVKFVDVIGHDQLSTILRSNYVLFKHLGDSEDDGSLESVLKHWCPSCDSVFSQATKPNKF